jgi:N-carbamoyl-L-amino-acid hydrolase
VPGGSTNVVPGRCQFTLDLRAPNDPQRDAMVPTCWPSWPASATRRGLRYTTGRNHARRRRAQRRRPGSNAGNAAVHALGVPLFRMPSGAGHDAMKLHEVMPQAMLFVRGRTAASATTRWNPPPATTCSWLCRSLRPQLLLSNSIDPK